MEQDFLKFIVRYQICMHHFTWVYLLEFEITDFQRKVYGCSLPQEMSEVKLVLLWHIYDIKNYELVFKQ